jgi:hypothetical protein
MESLLSLAFDNISSREGNKVRKGLRQIEGLLAQICLSQSAVRSPRKKAQIQEHSNGKAKVLGELREDAAFREFFRLQEGFQWNGELPDLDDSMRPVSSILTLHVSCITIDIDSRAPPRPSWILAE